MVGCGSDAVPEGDEEGETEGSDAEDGGPPPTSQDGSASSAEGTSGTSDETGVAESGEESSSGTTGDPVDPPIDLEFDWYPCPVYTHGDGLDAECVEVDVPLDYADPGGEQIELFIKRLGGSNGSHQIWLLNGGPGVSGAGFEGLGAPLAANDGLDVYLLDHRGVGRSSRLTCSAEGPATPGGPLIEADKLDPCIEELVETWGDGLEHFTTTNAARDLSLLIDENLDDVGEQVVHVFGGSYGTYWAHRYLQVAPDQAAGVSMLGVAAPGFDFRYWEREFNAAGERYLALCDDDPVCGPRLGPDAVARAHDILDAVEAGHCAAAGISREYLSAFFAGLNAWRWAERILTPAILYRLDRCNAGDVAALQHLGSMLGDPTHPLPSDPLVTAPLLGAHIKYSEMYKTPLPDVEELEEIHADTIYSFSSAAGGPAGYEAWPRYEPDDYVDVFAKTDTPVLMLEGEFDPNSPVGQAQTLGDALDGPNQYFYVFPGGNHNWSSPTYGGFDCSYSMFIDFINDPTTPPTDCRDDLIPVSFANNQSIAQTWLGTNDIWD